MPPLYSYPSTVRRQGLPQNRGRLHTQGVVQTMSTEEYEEEKEAQRKREARTDWKEKYLSVGSIKRVRKYLARDQMSRWSSKRTRFARTHRLRHRTPKSVLRKMKMLGIK